MAISPSMFKPGHEMADLTRVQSIDVLDPMPLEPVFEVPNAVVIDPEKEWACAVHGFSQDGQFVGTAPGSGGRGAITVVHMVIIVCKNPLHGKGHPIAGRYLRKALALPIFQFSPSDSQDSEVWYFGKPNLGRFNYANTKLGFFRPKGYTKVLLSQNGNWKWQSGWQGQRIPEDRDIPNFNIQFNIPAWQQGDYAVEVDNQQYWSHIPRNSTGHIEDHHGPQLWLPYDAEKYPTDRIHPYLPREDMRWEPDAVMMGNLPPEQLERYLQLHGLAEAVTE